MVLSLLSWPNIGGIYSSYWSVRLPLEIECVMVMSVSSGSALPRGKPTLCLLVSFNLTVLVLMATVIEQ